MALAAPAGICDKDNIQVPVQVVFNAPNARVRSPRAAPRAPAYADENSSARTAFRGPAAGAESGRRPASTSPPNWPFPPPAPAADSPTPGAFRPGHGLFLTVRRSAAGPARTQSAPHLVGQRPLIILERQHVTCVTNVAATARWQPIASMRTTLPRTSTRSNTCGMATSSLRFCAT